jgi:hypothetical protein
MRTEKVGGITTDIHNIISNASCVFVGGSGRVSDQFDYTFWFGDLNYRASATRTQADAWLCANQYQVIPDN